MKLRNNLFGLKKWLNINLWFSNDKQSYRVSKTNPTCQSMRNKSVRTHNTERCFSVMCIVMIYADEFFNRFTRAVEATKEVE